MSLHQRKLLMVDVKTLICETCEEPDSGVLVSVCGDMCSFLGGGGQLATSKQVNDVGKLPGCMLD